MKPIYLLIIPLAACVPAHQPFCERPWEEYWLGECRPRSENQDASEPTVAEREVEQVASEPAQQERNDNSSYNDQDYDDDDYDDDDDDDYDDDDDEDDDDDD